MDLETGLPIQVTVHSEITLGEETEKNHTHTDGKLFKKGETTYIQYTETIEGAGSVNNVVKVTHEGILIIRSGSVSMKQKFLIGQTTTGMYDSPFGQLWMETTTNQMNFRFNQQKQTGDLLLSYQLVLQGENTGNYTIKISFQEAKA